MSHQFTKDEIRLVATQWESKTKEEIAEVLGLEKFQVDYIANLLRKHGMNLTRKKVKGKLATLILEVVAEM